MPIAAAALMRTWYGHCRMSGKRCGDAIDFDMLFWRIILSHMPCRDLSFGPEKTVLVPVHSQPSGNPITVYMSKFGASAAQDPASQRLQGSRESKIW